MHAYMPVRRTIRWRTTPPVVVGDVVLAAPLDSTALLAFDLAEGRVLWSLSDHQEAELFGSRQSYDHLVGAQGDTIYLGGPELAALRCVGGLRAPSSWELAWRIPTPSALGSRTWLANGALFVPDGAGRLREFDARTGEERRVFASDATLGLLAQDTALFAVGGGTVERLER